MGIPAEWTARIRDVLQQMGDVRGVRERLENALAVLSEASGCESVGIRWKAGEDYPYLLTRGFGRDFTVVEGPLCARDAAGTILRHADGTPQLACLCGAVVSGRIDRSLTTFTDKGSFWTNGTTELRSGTPPHDAAGMPLRHYCNAVGYESVALIPLRVDETILGILQLNSRRPGRFSAERVAALESVAEMFATAAWEAREADCAA